jgi:hypothetical protein
MQSEAYIQSWRECGAAFLSLMAARKLEWKCKAAADKAFHAWAFTSPTLDTGKEYKALGKRCAESARATAALADAEREYENAQDTRTAITLAGGRSNG